MRWLQLEPPPSLEAPPWKRRRVTVEDLAEGIWQLRLSTVAEDNARLDQLCEALSLDSLSLAPERAARCSPEAPRAPSAASPEAGGAALAAAAAGTALVPRRRGPQRRCKVPRDTTIPRPITITTPFARFVVDAQGIAIDLPAAARAHLDALRERRCKRDRAVEESTAASAAIVIYGKPMKSNLEDAFLDLRL